MLIGGNNTVPSSNAYELYVDDGSGANGTGSITVLSGASTPSTLYSAASCFQGAVALDASDVATFGGNDCGATAATTAINIVTFATTTTTSITPVTAVMHAQRGLPAVVSLGVSGKVLVEGGFATAATTLAGTNTADLFSFNSGTPATSTVTATGTVSSGANYGGTATLLSASTCTGASTPTDCTVLVAGGNGASTAATYSLFSGAFTSLTNPMKAQRQFHTATLLPSGLVLFAGGVPTLGGVALSSTEVYDPSSSIKNFFTAEPMALTRQQFSAYTSTLFTNSASDYDVAFLGGATAASGVTTSPTVVEVEEITQ
jgi:hypothetical protein